MELRIYLHCYLHSLLLYKWHDTMIQDWPLVTVSSLCFRLFGVVLDADHQWVSEFVTQYWISMYDNSWNICKATSHCFLDCSSDQGTIIKAKWQLSSKCPSSYSTLNTSIASRIRTTTGGLRYLFNLLLRFTFDFWVRRSPNNNPRAFKSIADKCKSYHERRKAT